MLGGADDVLKKFESELGVRSGETTQDGRYTLVEVECLGACSNAPVVIAGGKYIEDLDVKDVPRIVDSLKKNKEVKGSMKGRKSSAPLN